MPSPPSILFRIIRPGRYWDVVQRHLPLAALTALPLAAAALVLPARLPLPACRFLKLTSYPCPFCGYTRAFYSIAHGHWYEALFNCPLAFPVFGAIAAVFTWHTAGLVTGRIIERGEMLKLNGRRGKLLIIAITALLLANWLFRLSRGLA
jgi:hypothetical protein